MTARPVVPPLTPQLRRLYFGVYAPLCPFEAPAPAAAPEVAAKPVKAAVKGKANPKTIKRAAQRKNARATKRQGKA